MPTANVPPVQVMGVVGSLRRESYNRRLLHWIAGRAPATMSIDVHDDAVRLPLFDEDLEVDGLPAPVEAQHAAVRDAEAIIIATPEYNFGVPGPMKNWVDWLSRPTGKSPLKGKPVLLVGASTGRVGGTVQAQSQLRISLAVVGAQVVAHPPVLLNQAASRFEGDEVTDETAAMITDLGLRRLIELMEALRPDER